MYPYINCPHVKLAALQRSIESPEVSREFGTVTSFADPDIVPANELRLSNMESSVPLDMAASMELDGLNSTPPGPNVSRAMVGQRASRVSFAVEEEVLSGSVDVFKKDSKHDQYDAEMVEVQL